MRRPNLDSLPDVPLLPSGYVLQVMQSGDENEVAALLAQAFENPDWTTERAHECFTADPNVPITFLVRNADSFLAATASVQFPEHDLPHTGFLHWVGAAKSEQGHRLGRLVCLRVLHEFLHLGKIEARLKTDDFRLPAIKTYLALDFRPVIADETHAARWDAIAHEMPSPYQKMLGERY